MGMLVNPGNQKFANILNGTYVDKSGLISYVNKSIRVEGWNLTCFSRPRRFGKTFAIGMLCAYYDRSCDSKHLFEHLEIAADPSFETHRNQYNVISLDMISALFRAQRTDKELADSLCQELLLELIEEFPDCGLSEQDPVSTAMCKVVKSGNAPFIFLIDEWDAPFREHKEDAALLKKYLGFLRNLFKDNSTSSKTIAAAYMTGILPIRKYGTESALTDFREITMLNPYPLEKYVGFTEAEVKKLCKEAKMKFAPMRTWYDGYSFGRLHHVYNPRSVMCSIKNRNFSNYWTSSETYESLAGYIGMNFDGLKDAIVEMLSAKSIRIQSHSFKNDLTSFCCRDDVLTLLVHLGYLNYNPQDETVAIPNQEISEVFRLAVMGNDWTEVMEILDNSTRLLEATWNCDEKTVAEALEKAHETYSSILRYNNEASLASAVLLSYISARRYYEIVPELPSGKGYVDLAFLPRSGSRKPGLLIELKYNQEADTAIRQIHENRYTGSLKKYFGKLLLVGIAYDKDATGVSFKHHSCKIEQF